MNIKRQNSLHNANSDTVDFLKSNLEANSHVFNLLPNNTSPIFEKQQLIDENFVFKRDLLSSRRLKYKSTCKPDIRATRVKQLDWNKEHMKPNIRTSSLMSSLQRWIIKPKDKAVEPYIESFAIRAIFPQEIFNHLKIPYYVKNYSSSIKSSLINIPTLIAQFDNKSYIHPHRETGQTSIVEQLLPDECAPWFLNPFLDRMRNLLQPFLSPSSPTSPRPLHSPSATCHFQPVKLNASQLSVQTIISLFSKCTEIPSSRTVHLVYTSKGKDIQNGHNFVNNIDANITKNTTISKSKIKAGYQFKSDMNGYSQENEDNKATYSFCLSIFTLELFVFSSSASCPVPLSNYSPLWVDFPFLAFDNSQLQCFLVPVQWSSTVPPNCSDYDRVFATLREAINISRESRSLTFAKKMIMLKQSVPSSFDRNLEANPKGSSTVAYGDLSKVKSAVSDIFKALSACFEPHTSQQQLATVGLANVFRAGICLADVEKFLINKLNNPLNLNIVQNAKLGMIMHNHIWFSAHDRWHLTVALRGLGPDSVDLLVGIMRLLTVGGRPVLLVDYRAGRGGEHLAAGVVDSIAVAATCLVHPENITSYKNDICTFNVFDVLADIKECCKFESLKAFLASKTAPGTLSIVKIPPNAPATINGPSFMRDTKCDVASLVSPMSPWISHPQGNDIDVPTEDILALNTPLTPLQMRSPPVSSSPPLPSPLPSVFFLKPFHVSSVSHGSDGLQNFERSLPHPSANPPLCSACLLSTLPLPIPQAPLQPRISSALRTAAKALQASSCLPPSCNDPSPSIHHLATPPPLPYRFSCDDLITWALLEAQLSHLLTKIIVTCIANGLVISLHQPPHLKALASKISARRLGSLVESAVKIAISLSETPLRTPDIPPMDSFTFMSHTLVSEALDIACAVCHVASVRDSLVESSCLAFSEGTAILMIPPSNSIDHPTLNVGFGRDDINSLPFENYPLSIQVLSHAVRILLDECIKNPLIYLEKAESLPTSPPASVFLPPTVILHVRGFCLSSIGLRAIANCMSQLVRRTNRMVAYHALNNLEFDFPNPQKLLLDTNASILSNSQIPNSPSPTKKDSKDEKISDSIVASPFTLHLPSLGDTLTKRFVECAQLAQHPACLYVSSGVSISALRTLPRINPWAVESLPPGNWPFGSLVSFHAGTSKPADYSSDISVVPPTQTDSIDLEKLMQHQINMLTAAAGSEALASARSDNNNNNNNMTNKINATTGFTSPIRSKPNSSSRPQLPAPPKRVTSDFSDFSGITNTFQFQTLEPANQPSMRNPVPPLMLNSPSQQLPYVSSKNTFHAVSSNAIHVNANLAAAVFMRDLKASLLSDIYPNFETRVKGLLAPFKSISTSLVSYLHAQQFKIAHQHLSNVYKNNNNQHFQGHVIFADSNTMNWQQQYNNANSLNQVRNHIPVLSATFSSLAGDAPRNYQESIILNSNAHNHSLLHRNETSSNVVLNAQVEALICNAFHSVISAQAHSIVNLQSNRLALLPESKQNSKNVFPYFITIDNQTPDLASALPPSLAHNQILSFYFDLSLKSKRSNNVSNYNVTGGSDMFAFSPPTSARQFYTPHQSLSPTIIHNNSNVILPSNNRNHTFCSQSNQFVPDDQTIIKTNNSTSNFNAIKHVVNNSDPVVIAEQSSPHLYNFRKVNKFLSPPQSPIPHTGFNVNNVNHNKLHVHSPASNVSFFQNNNSGDFKNEFKEPIRSYFPQQNFISSISNLSSTTHNMKKMQKSDNNDNEYILPEHEESGIFKPRLLFSNPADKLLETGLTTSHLLPQASKREFLMQQSVLDSSKSIPIESILSESLKKNSLPSPEKSNNSSNHIHFVNGDVSKEGNRFTNHYNMTYNSATAMLNPSVTTSSSIKQHITFNETSTSLPNRLVLKSSSPSRAQLETNSQNSKYLNQSQLYEVSQNQNGDESPFQSNPDKSFIGGNKTLGFSVDIEEDDEQKQQNETWVPFNASKSGDLNDLNNSSSRRFKNRSESIFSNSLANPLKVSGIDGGDITYDDNEKRHLESFFPRQSLHETLPSHSSSLSDDEMNNQSIEDVLTKNLISFSMNHGIDPHINSPLSKTGAVPVQVSSRVASIFPKTQNNVHFQTYYESKQPAHQDDENNNNNNNNNSKSRNINPFHLDLRNENKTDYNFQNNTQEDMSLQGGFESPVPYDLPLSLSKLSLAAHIPPPAQPKLDTIHNTTTKNDKGNSSFPSVHRPPPIDVAFAHFAEGFSDPIANQEYFEDPVQSVKYRNSMVKSESITEDNNNNNNIWTHQLLLHSPPAGYQTSRTLAASHTPQTARSQNHVATSSVPSSSAATLHNQIAHNSRINQLDQEPEEDFHARLLHEAIRLNSPVNEADIHQRNFHPILNNSNFPQISKSPIISPLQLILSDPNNSISAAGAMTTKHNSINSNINHNNETQPTKAAPSEQIVATNLESTAFSPNRPIIFAADPEHSVPLPQGYSSKPIPIHSPPRPPTLQLQRSASLNHDVTNGLNSEVGLIPATLPTFAQMNPNSNSKTGNFFDPSLPITATVSTPIIDVPLIKSALLAEKTPMPLDIPPELIIAVWRIPAGHLEAFSPVATTSFSIPHYPPTLHCASKSPLFSSSSLFDLDQIIGFSRGMTDPSEVFVEDWFDDTMDSQFIRRRGANGFAEDLIDDLNMKDDDDFRANRGYLSVKNTLSNAMHTAKGSASFDSESESSSTSSSLFSTDDDGTSQEDEEDDNDEEDDDEDEQRVNSSPTALFLRNKTLPHHLDSSPSLPLLNRQHASSSRRMFQTPTPKNNVENPNPWTNNGVSGDFSNAERRSSVFTNNSNNIKNVGSSKSGQNKDISNFIAHDEFEAKHRSFTSNRRSSFSIGVSQALLPLQNGSKRSLASGRRSSALVLRRGFSEIPSALQHLNNQKLKNGDDSSTRGRKVVRSNRGGDETAVFGRSLSDGQNSNFGFLKNGRRKRFNTQSVFSKRNIPNLKGVSRKNNGDFDKLLLSSKSNPCYYKNDDIKSSQSFPVFQSQHNVKQQHLNSIFRLQPLQKKSSHELYKMKLLQDSDFRSARENEALGKYMRIHGKYRMTEKSSSPFLHCFSTARLKVLELGADVISGNFLKNLLSPPGFCDASTSTLRLWDTATLPRVTWTNKETNKVQASSSFGGNYLGEAEDVYVVSLQYESYLHVLPPTFEETQNLATLEKAVNFQLEIPLKATGLRLFLSPICRSFLVIGSSNIDMAVKTLHAVHTHMCIERLHAFESALKYTSNLLSEYSTTFHTMGEHFEQNYFPASNTSNHTKLPPNLIKEIRESICNSLLFSSFSSGSASNDHPLKSSLLDFPYSSCGPILSSATSPPVAINFRSGGSYDPSSKYNYKGPSLMMKTINTVLLPTSSLLPRYIEPLRFFHSFFTRLRKHNQIFSSPNLKSALCNDNKSILIKEPKKKPASDQPLAGSLFKVLGRLPPPLLEALYAGWNFFPDPSPAAYSVSPCTCSYLSTSRSCRHNRRHQVRAFEVPHPSKYIGCAVTMGQISSPSTAALISALLSAPSFCLSADCSATAISSGSPASQLVSPSAANGPAPRLLAGEEPDLVSQVLRTLTNPTVSVSFASPSVSVSSSQLAGGLLFPPCLSIPFLMHSSLNASALLSAVRFVSPPLHLPPVLLPPLSVQQVIQDRGRSTVNSPDDLVRSTLSHFNYIPALYLNATSPANASLMQQRMPSLGNGGATLLLAACDPSHLLASICDLYMSNRSLMILSSSSQCTTSACTAVLDIMSPLDRLDLQPKPLLGRNHLDRFLELVAARGPFFGCSLVGFVVSAAEVLQLLGAQLSKSAANGNQGGATPGANLAANNLGNGVGGLRRSRNINMMNSNNLRKGANHSPPRLQQPLTTGASAADNAKRILDASAVRLIDLASSTYHPASSLCLPLTSKVSSSLKRVRGRLFKRLDHLLVKQACTLRTCNSEVLDKNHNPSVASIVLHDSMVALRNSILHESGEMDSIFNNTHQNSNKNLTSGAVSDILQAGGSSAGLILTDPVIRRLSARFIALSRQCTSAVSFAVASFVVRTMILAHCPHAFLVSFQQQHKHNSIFQNALPGSPSHRVKSTELSTSINPTAPILHRLLSTPNLLTVSEQVKTAILSSAIKLLMPFLASTLPHLKPDVLEVILKRLTTPSISLQNAKVHLLMRPSATISVGVTAAKQEENTLGSQNIINTSKIISIIAEEQKWLLETWTGMKGNIWVDVFKDTALFYLPRGVKEVKQRKLYDVNSQQVVGTDFELDASGWSLGKLWELHVDEYLSCIHQEFEPSNQEIVRLNSIDSNIANGGESMIGIGPNGVDAKEKKFLIEILTNARSQVITTFAQTINARMAREVNSILNKKMKTILLFKSATTQQKPENIPVSLNDNSQVPQKSPRNANTNSLAIFDNQKLLSTSQTVSLKHPAQQNHPNPQHISPSPTKLQIENSTPPLSTPYGSSATLADHVVRAWQQRFGEKKCLFG